jgi:hypothetical protein
MAHNYSRQVSAVIALVLPAATLGADTEIHRCPQQDGTVAFQETPCPPIQGDAAQHDISAPESTLPEDAFFDFDNPYNGEEPEPEPAAAAPASADQAVCVKSTRDAIDEIDDKMRKGYSKEEGQSYLAELLELTRRLRACKQPQPQ